MKSDFDWRDIDDIAEVIATAAEVLASRWWPILLTTLLFFIVTTGFTITIVVRQLLILQYLQEDAREENKEQTIERLKLGD